MHLHTTPDDEQQPRSHAMVAKQSGTYAVLNERQPNLDTSTLLLMRIPRHETTIGRVTNGDVINGSDINGNVQFTCTYGLTQ